MKLSFIIPARNNLKYLKWSYASIRKNLDFNHEICVADDFSNDGTLDWLNEISKSDSNLKFIRNDGPQREGHCILYDKLVDISSNDQFIIWHSDMFCPPGLDVEISKLLKPKTFVTITRIEPPLHPSGQEKILNDFGTEPENFNEQGFLKFVEENKQERYTQGMFAPWAIYKNDFLEIGGHDPVFFPQSKEDSDIFNRFILNGITPVQTWNIFTYHLTCRGSRFNPQLTSIGKNSSEWEIQNLKSHRNFIRKWGTHVRHDEQLKPSVTPKYDIAFVITNCNLKLLHELEPFGIVYSDCPEMNQYIEYEQPNTLYDLKKRVKILLNIEEHGIVISFDANQITNETINLIPKFPDILAQSGQKKF